MSSTTETESIDGDTAIDAAQLEAAELSQSIRLASAQAVEVKSWLQHAAALSDGTVRSDWPPAQHNSYKGALPNPPPPGPGGRQAIGISAAVIGGSFVLIALAFVVATYWWAIFPIVGVGAGLVVVCAYVLGRDEGRRHCAALRARCEAEAWWS